MACRYKCIRPGNRHLHDLFETFSKDSLERMVERNKPYLGKWDLREVTTRTYTGAFVIQEASDTTYTGVRIIPQAPSTAYTS